MSIGQSIEPFTVRAATNLDCEQVQALVSRVLEEFGLAADAEVDSELQDLQLAYQDAGGIFEVVEHHHSRIVGCAGLLPLEGGEAELRKMYLLPEFRGRGIGKLLLARMIGHAGRMGVERIVLETAERLEAALQLYGSVGFVRTDRKGHALRCDLVLELNLANTGPSIDSTPPL